LNVDNKIEDLQEQLEDAAALAQQSPTTKQRGESDTETDTKEIDETFMSESIYEKLPSPSRPKRPHKTISALGRLLMSPAISNIYYRAEVYANLTRTF